ncbi:MAG: hypothetical protein HY575_01175 [candidate division NC10 bacterium]|nr:hypothetical protein [candidate division NC10 bacterium]MBI4390469.1 hypothetical protein [candidate division NC10 bacterium]
MAQGVIRKRGAPAVLGTWRADARSLSVQTEDPALRAAADRILSTPQLIPQKPARHWEEAGPGAAVRTPPAAYKYIPLFVLELESLGYEVEQTDDEG